MRLGTFSFARVTGPGETYAVRTAVDSLIEFANFSSNIFSDSRVYSNWEPQHIIGKFDNCCRIPNHFVLSEEANEHLFDDWN